MNKAKIPNQNLQNLAANIDLPDSPPLAYALFAHCFTCSKDIHTVRNISKGLTKKGIAVLRFDFTGLGRSEGSFDESNFSANISDIVSVSEYMEEHFQAPSILIGHSLGGAASIFAAGKLPSLKCLVTVNAPSEVGHVKHLLGSNPDDIQESETAEINIGGRPFQISGGFVKDLDRHDLKTTLKQLRLPYLIMHSPTDEIVDIHHAGELYKNAKHPKNFVSLDNMDHLISDKNDAVYIGQLIASWTGRYITDNITESNENNTKVKNLTGVLASLKDNPYTTQIFARNHSIVSDEPLSLNGADKGMTPTELLKGSLASCTAITLKMYVGRKEIPITSIDVTVESSKEEGQTVYHRKLDITSLETLPEDKVKRLLYIANRCPVHKLLEKSVVVKTTLNMHQA